MISIDSLFLRVQLPQQLIDAIRSAKGFDETSFRQVHDASVTPTSIRVNPAKAKGVSGIGSLSSIVDSKVPWSEFAWYLKERPSFTFDPLFHAGCYYVQEASSMFLEQALKQHAALSDNLRVLDISAAPGGKSTHIQSLLSPGSLLVSNDVIRPRANILRDNMIRWGCENVVVTNNDPRDFTQLEGFFDVIVVDAPCSGSGLFRKESDAISEWSTGNVDLCSQRQQRILADVLPALKENGLLVYSTCSYSLEEDEDIGKWLVESFELDTLRINVDEDWNISETNEDGTYGYRFWPHKVKGEGFYLSCFRKTSSAFNAGGKSFKEQPFSKGDMQMIERWMKTSGKTFIRHENTVYAWPEDMRDEIRMLLGFLRVNYSGVRVGDLMRDKLVPDHALAMTNLVKDDINTVELEYEQAIKYLQKKDIQPDTNLRGWCMVSFQGHPLGWANILSNRINNYYPKELRILKDNEG